MTEQIPDREAIDTAQGLIGVVRGLTAEVKHLRRYGRTNRKFVLIDIALTLAVFLAGGLAVRATQSASDANSAQLALCQSSNVARHQQIDLWDFLIHLSGPPRTAKGRKLIGAFEHHLEVVYAPRNCAALGKGP